jgi:hypothetical protein
MDDLGSWLKRKWRKETESETHHGDTEPRRKNHV